MTRPLLAMLIAFGVVAGFSLTFAQTTPPPSDESEVELTVSPVAPEVTLKGFAGFSHVIHTARRLKTTCVDCHRLGVDGNRFRPSPDETCTSCHIGDSRIAEYRKSWDQTAADQRSPANKVEPIHRTHIYYDCVRCHSNMAYSARIGDVPLPPTINTHEACIECHGRAVRFSHRAHLRVDGKVATDCSTCHQERCDKTQYSSPGHPECWTCHDITLLALTDGCNLCHLPDARATKQFNVERATVVHRQHPRAQVPCEKCHAAILRAESLAEVNAARDTSAIGCDTCHKLPK